MLNQYPQALEPMLIGVFIGHSRIFPGEKQ
jgi:hypothetical protein